MTNFEKIKAMNIEEMAKKILGVIDWDCQECPMFDKCDNGEYHFTDCFGCKDLIKIWLESEADENE